MNWKTLFNETLTQEVGGFQFDITDDITEIRISYDATNTSGGASSAFIALNDISSFNKPLTTWAGRISDTHVIKKADSWLCLSLLQTNGTSKREDGSMGYNANPQFYKECFNGIKDVTKLSLIGGQFHPGGILKIYVR